jgi:Ser/Thr protein kinase RdoA (MazF antagonist)
MHELSSWIPLLTEAFHLGDPVSVSGIHSGLIQQTWRVSTTRGIYIAQKLHPIFQETVTQDGNAISTYLRHQGFCLPEYLTTQTGSLHFYDEYQRPWRVMPCLPGSTYAVPPHLGYLEEAGWFLGGIHQALQSFDYSFQFQIPHFHNTEYILRRLQDYIQKDSDSRIKEIQAEAEFLLQTIPSLLLPRDLPQQIIHGDLKLTNFLFTEEGKVAALLDLDTFMYHTLYVEMGDALRSWIKRDGTVNVDAFQSALRGYARSGLLQTLEPIYLLQGLKLITLELSTRFLIDYIEDYYFDWDPTRYPDRKAHNQARCQSQIDFYTQIVDREDILWKILAH